MRSGLWYEPGTSPRSNHAMLGVLFLFFGLMPFLIGAYAWSLVRRRDEDGPDEPPPPPEPETPLPIVPPSLHRLDRAPMRPSPVRTRWTAPRRVGR